MQAELQWSQGVQFVATSGSGHTITIDGPVESGGQNGGARPMELVLIGTGACASYDVVTILQKGREPIEDCKVQLKATRAEEAPKVFERVQMHFIVSGPGLTESKVARAVALSAEKYCSASIMLSRAGVSIEHSYEVVDTTPAGEVKP